MCNIVEEQFSWFIFNLVTIYGDTACLWWWVSHYSIMNFLILLGITGMQGQKGFKLKESTFTTRNPTPKRKDPAHRSKFLYSSGPGNSADRSLEEASDTIAYKIAEAEAKSFLASEAVKEAEKILSMQEEAESLVLLADEILERCK